MSLKIGAVQERRKLRESGQEPINSLVTLLAIIVGTIVLVAIAEAIDMKTILEIWEISVAMILAASGIMFVFWVMSKC